MKCLSQDLGLYIVHLYSRFKTTSWLRSFMNMAPEAMVISVLTGSSAEDGRVKWLCRRTIELRSTEEDILIHYHCGCLLATLVIGLVIGGIAVFAIIAWSTPHGDDSTNEPGMMSALLGRFSNEQYKDPGRDGKLQISLGMRNDYLLQDCMYGGLKKTFPDLDYALMGYNVLKGFPLAAGHDPGFTQPIFKADYSKYRQTADCKFSIPEGYTVVPDVSCETSFTSETIKNSEQFKKAMGVSAQVSGGGWGVSFSASASYKKNSETVAKGEKVLIISRATCQCYFVRRDDVTPPPLDESFLKWVERLNKSGTNKDFIEFIAYYGTHYMKAVTFGARYLHQHSVSQSSYSELKSQSISVEAQASYSGLFSVGGSFGFSSDKSSAVENFNKKVETKTLTVGSAPPKSGDALEWAAAAKQTPVPYRYEMESLEKLFTPALQERYPHIDTGKIKRELEYIRLRHSKDIYMKSLGKLCRVYNSAIPLAKTCLIGASYSLDVDEKHCIQACLNQQGCVGITIKDEKSCHYFTNTSSIQVKPDGTKSKTTDKCRSMLFPFMLETHLDSYMPEEKPGMLTIVGGFINENKLQEHHNHTAGPSPISCVDKCLKQMPGCVLAAYKNTTSGELCYLFKGEDVAELNFMYRSAEYYYIAKTFLPVRDWVIMKRSYYITFIKTCQF